jgi:hypothetical protein
MIMAMLHPVGRRIRNFSRFVFSVIVLTCNG